MAAVVVAEVVKVVVMAVAVISLLTYLEGDITTTWESFPVDFAQFRRSFLNANRRTHGHTDGLTDARTNRFIDMRGRIYKDKNEKEKKDPLFIFLAFFCI